MPEWQPVTSMLGWQPVASTDASVTSEFAQHLATVFETRLLIYTSWAKTDLVHF